MTRQLVMGVVVHDDDGPHIYQPGDVVPDEHAALISNPTVWAEEPEAPSESPDAQPELIDEVPEEPEAPQRSSHRRRG